MAKSLQHLREITNLDSVTVTDVLELFASFTDGEGFVSRDAFYQCFQEISEGSNTSESELRPVVEQLYNIFDSDKNGKLDFVELSVGLSVLCAGTRDEKAKSAFSLFDYDGSGSISRQEMERYLTCVFRVVYEIEKQTKDAMGVPPEQLAKITTDQCFDEADLDDDDSLSFEEFKKWYARPSGATTTAKVVRQASDTANNAISLESVKQITGLGSRSVEDVMEMFAEVTDDNGFVSRSSFASVFMSLNDDMSQDDGDRLRLVMDRLFDTLDKDSNGMLDFVELSTGISVLCGGSRDTKAAAAFALYDVNGDGTISSDEMTRYLTSVFNIMYAVEPGTEKKMGCSAAELALVTTQAAFKEAGLGDDGDMSFEMFQKWYSGEDTGKIVQQASDVAAGTVSLEELKRISGLGRRSPTEVMEMFANVTNEEGYISMESFAEVFEELVSEEDVSDEDIDKLHVALGRLFDSMDENGDGKLDFVELSSGLTVLCGGSVSEKTQSAFALYDLDGNGSISLEEFEHYLTSVFKVMYELEPGTEEAMGCGPTELAMVTAAQAFKECDLNGDGSISYEEFYRWYNTTDESSSSKIVQAATANAVENISLAEIRRVTTLGNRNIKDVLNDFAEVADEDGLVSEEHFDDIFEEYCSDSSDDDKARLHLILGRLFEMADEDGNGSVDFQELATFLTVLCAGTRDERAEIAFSLYDYDGNGSISREEMERFLTSIFKVMYEAEPSTRDQMQCDPETLAEVTTQDAFQKLGLGADDMMSYEDFEKWYTSKDSTSTGAMVRQASDAAQKWISLDEIKRLTTLGTRSVDEVLSHFSEVSDSNGNITEEAFDELFEKYVGKNLTQDDADKLHLVLARLFDMFDENNDNLISYQEFGTGLTILCGGSRDDRARAAFNVVDQNGDGAIDEKELEMYLSSVFRIMYEVDSTTEAEMGTDYAQLAKITAREAFVEADTDGDGKISYSEFRKWYSSDQEDDLGQIVRDLGDAASEHLSLAEMRHLTNLDSYSVEEMMELLAAGTNEEGWIERDAFDTCFNEIAREKSRSDPVRFRLVLDKLFRLFDKDGNGVVDFAEVSTALTVLCRGGRDEKAATAFALWDSDGSGTITLDEMTAYLKCVFSLMYEANPETEKHMQVSAEELAKATAKQAFSDADVNHDDVLTFAEFQEWYSSSADQDGGSGRRAEIIRDISENAGSWVSLSEIKRITGFGLLSLAETLEVFAQACDDEGYINRELFDLCCVEIAGKDLSDEDTTKLSIIIERLFKSFSGSEKKVDFVDLSGALAVLCGGDMHEKSRIVFALYDTDNSKTISLEEFERFLTSIYTVMYDAEPDTESEVGMTALELAISTSASVFKEADLDHNGFLTYDEFRRWYETEDEESMDEESMDEEEEDEEEEEDHNTAVENLEFMKEITSLGKRSVSSVLEMFAGVSDEQGFVHEEDFDKVFREIADAENMSEEKRQILEEVTDSLFQLWDKDGNGLCDFMELSVGLSVLCGSDISEKADTLFSLFDYDNSGSISREEFERYLTSVFEIMYAMDPDAESRIGCGPTELAIRTTDTCFKMADLDDSNSLSLEEFKKWYSSDQGELIQQASDVASQNISLDEVRRITTLGKRNVQDVLEMFALATDDEGYVSEEAFDSIFEELCKDSSQEDQDKLHLVLDKLYAAADSNGDGKLDYQELATCLVVLTGGNIQQRSAAAFHIYDFNNDGVIQKEELVRFLNSVYNVMYSMDSETESRVGMDAASLALVTADSIMKDADTDGSGGLSFEEFSKWYSTPEGQAVNEVVNQAASWVSLPKIKSLTTLGNRSIHEVLEKFASVTDSKGYVSRSSFEAVFHSLVPLSELSSEDRERFHQVLTRLFNTFDQDKNGVLDFVELSSGLSVLCGGTMQERADTAFSLYDIDGNGKISLEEMTRYLTSVFKVIYESEPSMNMEMSAEELAATTALNAFKTADLNHDGTLSKEEFQRWYSTQDGEATQELEKIATGKIDLTEIRRLTTLDKRSIFTCLDTFASVTDHQGFVSEADFDRIFDEWTADVPASDKDRLHLILGRLYDAIAGDDSVLDFQELATALCVLCNSDNAFRSQIAFSLHDTDGSGYIDQEEMQRHLETVYKVLYALEPGTEERMGIDAATLALVVSDGIMKASDLNEDGKLSFSEFKKWYEGQEQDQNDDEEEEEEEEETENNHKSGVSALMRIKEITTLGDRDIKETLTLFAEAADKNGYVSEEKFDDVFEAMIEDPHPDLEDTLDTLYNAFDENGDGVLDVRELMIGLIVLSGGDMHTKAIAAFKLFDLDNSNTIDKKELETYLKSVYRIMYAIDSSIEKQTGVDAATLASQSATLAFQEADSDHNGVITWDEFQNWYMGTQQKKTSSFSSEGMSLQEIREITGLGSLDVTDVLERIADATNSDGLVTREKFQATFEDISGSKVSENPKLYKALGIIYNALDTNGDNVLDFTELASGISLFTGGSHSSKTSAQFALYDYDGNGSISEVEMERFLTSVFKVMYSAEPQTQAEMGGLTPAQLAKKTAARAFEEADLDKNGSISYAEFVAWSKHEDGTGAVARQATEQAKRFTTVQRIRELTSLGSHSVFEMLELFAAATQDDGTISKAAFTECFHQLSGKNRSQEDSDELRLVIDRIYDIFSGAVTDDNVVDFVEVCTGLSVLCEGHKSEKVQAVFALYDVDDAGEISRDDMVRYLASVFKIALELMPEKQVQGLSADELAEVTVAGAFEKLGLGSSDSISFEGFETWSQNAM